MRVFIQTLNQEYQEVKMQLTTEQERVSDLLNKFKDLEVKANSSFPFKPSSECCLKIHLSQKSLKSSCHDSSVKKLRKQNKSHGL